MNNQKHKLSIGAIIFTSLATILALTIIIIYVYELTKYKALFDLSIHNIFNILIINYEISMYHL